jgi:hypothetical protein
VLLLSHQPPYTFTLPNDHQICLTNLHSLCPFQSILHCLITHLLQPHSPYFFYLSLTSMKKHLNQCPASPPNQSAPSKFNTVLF